MRTGGQTDISGADLCNIYKNHPPSDRRKIIGMVVALYVNHMLENNNYDEAFKVLENAYKSGILDSRMTGLYRKLKALKTVRDRTQEVLEAEKTILDKMESGTITTGDIDSFRNKISRLIDSLVEAGRHGIDTAEYYRLVNKLLDFHDLLKEYIKISSLEKKITSYMESLNNKKNINYIDVSNKLNSYKYQLNRLINELKSLSLRTDAFTDFKQKLITGLENMAKQLGGLAVLYNNMAYITGELEEFMDKVSNYGGDNNLFNQSYVESVRSSLARLLSLMNGLRMLETQYPSIGGNIHKVFTQLYNYLSELKERLVHNDKRWNEYVFKVAEQRSGLKLPEVTEEGGVTQAINQIIQWMRDAGHNLLNSDEWWKQLWGALTIIGAGVSEALSTVVIPEKLVESIKYMAGGLIHTAENLLQGNTEKVKQDAQNMFNAMFGTKENALFTIGNLLAFEVGGKVASKIPLPRRLAWVRASLESFAKGDPVNATIQLMKHPRVASRFEEVARFLPQDYALYSKIMRSLKDRVMSRISERLVKAHANRIIRENMGRVREIVAKAISDPKKLVKLNEEINRLVKDIGVENARKLALKYKNTLTELSSNIDLSFISNKSLVSRLGLKVPSELAKYFKMEQLKKVAPMLKNDLKNVLEKKNRLLELLDDIKPFIAEDEWLRLREKLKGATKELYDARVTKAISLLEDLENILKKQTNIKTKLNEIADLLEGHGYKDIAEQVRHGDVSGLHDLIVNKKLMLSSETAKLLDTILDVVGELSRNKALNTKISMLLDSIKDTVVHRLDEMPIGDLNAYAMKVIEHIKKAKNVPDEIQYIVREFEKKASKGAVTLEDFKNLVDALASHSVELASLVDLGAITTVMNEAVRTVERLIDELGVRGAEVSKLLDSINGKIVEMEKIAREGAGIQYIRELSPVTHTLQDTLYEMAEQVRKVDPSFYNKFKTSVDRFIDAIGKGDEKLIRETATDLYNNLRKYSSILGGIPHSIWDRLVSLKNTLLGKIFENKAINNAFRELASWIEEDLSKLPELPDGWGFVKIGVEERRFAPVMAPLDIIKEARRILSEKKKTMVRRIGGKQVTVERVVETFNDGSMKVSYEIKLPNGKKMTYYYEIKPRGNGKAYVHTQFYYDPEIAKVLQMDERFAREFLDEIDGGRIIEKIDPDYRILNQIVLKTDRGLMSLAKLFMRGIAESLPILAGLTTALSGAWRYVLAGDKTELLSDISPMLKPVDFRLKSRLEQLGLEGLGYIDCCGKRLVVVRPFEFKDIIDRIALIKYKDKIIPAIIEYINGQETLIVPDIDLEMPEIEEQDEQTITLTLSKEGLQTEEITFSPPPRGESTTGGAVLPSKYAGVPIVVGGRKTGKGVQYEILNI